MVVTDGLLLFFSGVVALATVVYAVLTWRLVAETRRMREVQTEPRVAMFLQLNNHVTTGVDLVIRNVGLGPAYNIRFTFQGDPTYFRDDLPFDQLPIIKDGLNYLAPNQTFQFLLGFLIGEAYKRAIGTPWSFNVIYTNQAGRNSNEKYTLDFSQFSQLPVGEGAPLHKIQQHLEVLQRDVHHLTTGFYKVRVITQSKQEAREEMEQFQNEQRGHASGEGDSIPNSEPASALSDT